VLREWQTDDWVFAHQWSSDPKAVAYMQFGPNTEEETKEFIFKVITYQTEEPRLHFELAVTLKETGEVIGGCGIRIVDAENQTASMGYMYTQRYWGHGYGTEAAAALVDFGFSKLKVHRIWATCDPENIGSARILEKAGMRKEAHFRQHMLVRGQWRDSLLYAILEDEYAALKQTDKR
jgi:RimJ/RimL family protein N-acetyltransferase